MATSVPVQLRIGVVPLKREAGGVQVRIGVADRAVQASAKSVDDSATAQTGAKKKLPAPETPTCVATAFDAPSPFICASSAMNEASVPTFSLSDKEDQRSMPHRHASFPWISILAQTLAWIPIVVVVIFAISLCLFILIGFILNLPSAHTPSSSDNFLETFPLQASRAWAWPMPSPREPIQEEASRPAQQNALKTSFVSKIACSSPMQTICDAHENPRQPISADPDLYVASRSWQQMHGGWDVLHELGPGGEVDVNEEAVGLGAWPWTDSLIFEAAFMRPQPSFRQFRTAPSVKLHPSKVPPPAMRTIPVELVTVATRAWTWPGVLPLPLSQDHIAATHIRAKAMALTRRTGNILMLMAKGLAMAKGLGSEDPMHMLLMNMQF